MKKRPRMAIELGPRHLRGVVVDQQADALRVVASFCEPRPDLPKAEVAAWMKTVFDRHGVPRNACILAVPRDEVVVKRLHLTTPRADELPEMVDLALRDDLHFGEDLPVIDFLVDHDTNESTNLLAAALPVSSLKRGRERMVSTGRPIAAMSLRLLGVRNLAGDIHGATTVCIDASGDDLEITLLAGRDVTVTRSASISSESDDRIESVVREVRRTWLSWQVEAEGPDVDRIMVFGSSEVADAVMTLMAELSSVKIEHVTSRSGIADSEQHPDLCWPLLGLIMGARSGDALIDFLNPRQPPDLAARRRQMALGVIAVLIILFGAIWTIGNVRTAGLRSKLAELETQRARLEPAWLRHHRDRYRLTHLDLWTGVHPDWVGSISVLIDRLEPVGSVVLDEVSGSLNYGGVDAPRNASSSEWTVDASTSLVLKVEAASRELGESFRQTWVQDSQWSVGTSGADTEDGQRLPFGLTIELILAEDDMVGNQPEAVSE